jgi:Periplasmic molybdate-binding protein/domain
VEYPDLRGIALAVRNGRIPAGIGNGETASRYNLDFRPAAIEEYYVAVSDENLQDFQDILNRIGNEGLRILKEYYRSYNINADLFTGRIFSSGIS